MTNGEKRNVGLAALASVLFLVSCSSTSKPVTGLEAVQQNRHRLDDTRDKLKKANEELKRLQRSLAELKDNFSKSSDSTTTEKAKTTLDRLALKVQEAELDLSDLLAHNRAVANDLDARLRAAAESNATLMNGDRQTPDKRAENQYRQNETTTTN